MITNGGMYLDRRSLLSAIGFLVVSAGFPTAVAASDDMDMPIYSCNYFSVFPTDVGYRIVFADGSVAIYELSKEGNSIFATNPDGSISIIRVDSQGEVYLDDMQAWTTEYRRQPDDPVPNGCVLMSTKKMTVEEAAAPSAIANAIIGALMPDGALSIAWSIAEAIFDYQVKNNSSMWVVMKHWYCDSPKMITRKEFYVYKDKACTKLYRSWVSESPVGVN